MAGKAAAMYRKNVIGDSCVRLDGHTFSAKGIRGVLYAAA